MSLVELRDVKADGGAVSGGAMDKVIVRKKIDTRILIGAGAGAILLIFLIFWTIRVRYTSSWKRMSTPPLASKTSALD